MLSLIVGPTRALVSVTHDEVDRGHGPYGFSLELPWPHPLCEFVMSPERQSTNATQWDQRSAM